LAVEKIREITGAAVPVRGDDIDTDRIIPARFLKSITFEGLEQHLFEDDRLQSPGHPLSNPVYASARIMLVQMEALPNLGPKYAADFHAIYPELSKELGVPLVPFLLDGVAGRSELNQSDGIHPNQRGERIVANNIWKSLRPVLDSLASGSD